MAVKRAKNYVLIFDYAADPDTDHAVIEAEVSDAVAAVPGYAFKLGRIVVLHDTAAAFALRLRFGEHVVEGRVR